MKKIIETFLQFDYYLMKQNSIAKLWSSQEGPMYSVMRFMLDRDILHL